jgi:hypothetical protein
MARTALALTDVWTRGQVAALALLIILTSSGVIGIASAFMLQKDVTAILLPAWATIVIFLAFFALLKWQIGDNLFGDLGFLYLSLTLAYTLLPAFGFLFVGLKEDDLLAPLLPAPADLGLHLWRHALFMFGVAGGYLVARGRGVPRLITHDDPEGIDGPTIVFLIGMAIICILCLTLMSAPVETYYDHYTRYDHLSWFPRKLVSLCVRLKLGIYTVLITFLFLNFKKYRLLIPVVVVAIAVHEIVYSLGSRIESLIILLGAACLYDSAVKPISLKKGLVTGVARVVLFSGREVQLALAESRGD